MKPETEKALRERTPEQMAEIVKLMLECMKAEKFAEAIEDDDGDISDRFAMVLRGFEKDTSVQIIKVMADELPADVFILGLQEDDSDNLTDDGQKIVDAIADAWPDDRDSKTQTKIADELHEAICEGRQDDAIRLLAELRDESYRSVSEQQNLFGRGRTAAQILADW